MALGSRLFVGRTFTLTTWPATSPNASDRRVSAQKIADAFADILGREIAVRSIPGRCCAPCPGRWGCSANA
jgi:hypothetical protein